jgi:hypothetical protein
MAKGKHEVNHALGLKEFLQKKVTAAAERRRAVAYLVRWKLSRRRACELVGIRRRWQVYEPKGEDGPLVRLLYCTRQLTKHQVSIIVEKSALFCIFQLS